MITITCDVCRKKLDDPRYGYDYFGYAHHSICEPCKDNFEFQVKGTVRKKDPFTFAWYENYIIDTLDKATQKGRI
jgi:hypothetical protein